MENIPAEFNEMMINLLGPIQADELLQTIEKGEASVGVRLNHLKEFGGFAGSRKVEWSESGFRLDERPVFSLMPEWHGGAFYVQEPASMVYEKIVKELFSGPVRALDLCAAPGGKTTAMMSGVPEGSLFVANEVNRQRAQILKENLMKWGAENYIVASSPVEAFGNMGEEFDLVAVDAPCSGEGMMRKDPQAVAQWSPGLVKQCESVQRGILPHAVAALREGGYLLYSTCTFNRKENEEMMEWLVEEYPLESVDTGLAGKYGISGGIDTDIHALRFFPHLTGSEGLFVALLRKTDTIAVKAENNRKVQKNVVRMKPTSVPEWLSPLQRSSAIRLDMDGEEKLCVLSERDVKFASKICCSTSVLNLGIESAELKGKNLIPSHDSFMSSAFRKDAFPILELSREEALDYLRKENLPGYADIKKGVCGVSYNGIILGRINNLGNRSNNLYPRQYKIRVL